MKIKSSLSALSTTLLLTLIGCSSDAPTTSPTPDSAVETTSADVKSSELMARNDSIISGTGLPDLRIGDQAQNAIGLFGESSASTSGYLNFPGHGISVKHDDNERITRIFYYFRLPEYTAFNGKTRAGIGADSTIADVIEKYGEPSKRGESVVSEFGAMPGAKEEWLSYEKTGLMFTFWDDALADIRSIGTSPIAIE